MEQVASNFRTLGTLQRTQAHLLAIMDRRDVPLAKIHHFLWDRCRGVRQDLFVQGYEVWPSALLSAVPALMEVQRANFSCAFIPFQHIKVLHLTHLRS